MTVTPTSDLRARVDEALQGGVEDLLAAHQAVAAALDADPTDSELRRLARRLAEEGSLARLRTLVNNPDIDAGDESIQDTLADISNYGLLGRLLAEGKL